MKAKLYKVLDQYHLYDGDKAIATTIVGNPMLLPNLSKQNCDEIFGVVDVEKLAENKYGKGIYEIEQVDAYVEGFNKAMELNKDKVFTLEDMMNCWNKALKFQEHKQTFGEYIQSLQQPTEIDVVIVMERILEGLDEMCQPQYAKVPKLDSSGNLILKKINNA
jgi:hypothetical protein